MSTSVLRLLPPPQRFMYEYGCFLSFWGNFELEVEVAIWLLRQPDSPIDNCRRVSRLRLSDKIKELARLLRGTGHLETASALEGVDRAARHDWIHGVVLNPRGDFSRLTRYRVHNKGHFWVENTAIEFNDSPFDEFYDAWVRFENAAKTAIGLDSNVCNRYIAECCRVGAPHSAGPGRSTGS